MERLRLAELSRIRARAKERDLADFSDKSAQSEHSFVDIQFKGRLIEQIEDGIYNIKRRGSGDSDFSLESLNDEGEPRFLDANDHPIEIEQNKVVEEELRKRSDS